MKIFQLMQLCRNNNHTFAELVLIVFQNGKSKHIYDLKRLHISNSINATKNV